MPGEVKLKPCPFCGGSEIEECDVSGEIWFRCKSCRAGTGIENFAKRDGLIAKWNRRAPEPGTSVILWTRYDGTPETLPDKEFRRPLLCIIAEDTTKKVVLFNFQDFGVPRWSGLFWAYERNVAIGDIWAYLPEPPEGMA